VIKLDKKINLILMIIITLSIMGSAGITYAKSSSSSSPSYTIPLINMDLYVQGDGSVHVKEVLHYSFTGTAHGINRYIPLSGSQKIQNINVSTQGAYSNFTSKVNGTNEQITVFLFSDPQETTPIMSKDVNVTLDYNYSPVIKFYTDTAELQYQLIGTGWAVNIGQVNANIHLNSSNGVKYWLNPPYYAQSSAWQGNTLNVVSRTIPSGNYFEVRMVIPKNQFANATNGIVINQNGLSQIESIQNNYQNQLNFMSNLYGLLSVLLLLGCFIPLLIWFLYGREPKIDYHAEYERDIPTDDPPAIVNAICGPGFSKKIGNPDLDGFKATIMDLIDRKYLLFENKPNPEEDTLLSSMYLKINPDKDNNDLKPFEIDVLNFLRGLGYGDIISMDKISSDLKDKKKAQSFRETYYSWKDDISIVLTDDVLSKIFNRKGDNYIKIFGGVGIAVAIIIFILTISNPIPNANLTAWTAVLFGVVAIVSLILPQRLEGQWTTYGEEYDAKWHNFKKYIKDFSLIKEYPPESVEVWNKYLVYATALGVADAVRKAMELYVPQEQLEGSDMYMFHYYGGYALLNESIDTGYATGTSDSGGNGGDFGGVGDIGGGFGGGGGDAF
jgi:uncharacterized membrane protein